MASQLVEPDDITHYVPLYYWIQERKQLTLNIHLGGDIVQPDVGPESNVKIFPVHEDLLHDIFPTLSVLVYGFDSDYLNKLVLGFSEETTLATVRLFLRWRYQDIFDCRATGQEPGRDLGKHARPLPFY
jgi:hypothetical protein